MRNTKTDKKKLLLSAAGVLIAGLSIAARYSHPDSIYNSDPEQKNPLEGKKVIFVEDENDNENADGSRGHLEAIGDTCVDRAVYPFYVKRIIDITLSLLGLIVLGPILGAISLAIIIDDPGPVLFTQKRMGQNKRFFKLHKFRSMKMSTPHDVPTHMLENPDQYITRVGKFLRAHSLDELPQIWDIFIGNMSVIGPRPALWNQDVLTSERDKYGVNEVKPGLTGWAQINGRDELELEVKARYDGDYVNQIRKGGIRAFLFDCKCFIGTIFSVARSEGVVEGGTGAMHDALRPGVPEDDPVTALGCDLELSVDRTAHKKVLITGAGSYIGESFAKYAEKNYPNLEVESIDMMDRSWRTHSFSGYDSIYHVAGIAHADVGNVSDEVKEKYYAVNTDLAIEVASKAKAEGVKQFVFMSSMIVYGDSAPYGKVRIIDRHTKPEPSNFYGDSKWQADRGVRALADEHFKVAVLRPPMIYGKGSKGNYPTLAKMAKKLPVFPDVDNERSMLFIDNLCEFLCNLFICGEGGIYFPQNEEYTNTSKMVQEIARTAGNKIIISKLFRPAVSLAAIIPGKTRTLANKAFGNQCYSHDISSYCFNYIVENLTGSIAKTESNSAASVNVVTNKLSDLSGKRILLIALPGYSDGIRRQMEELGAVVDYLNDKPNDGFICKTLGRLQIKSYQRVINRYYEEALDDLKDNKYDFVLSIRGEYTPVETLKMIRSIFPDAKLILYMWDGLHKTNTRNIEEKWPLYDRVYTFDRIDYEANKGDIDFLPLFYYNDYLPDNLAANNTDYKYDLSFIGTGHDDRIRIVKRIMNDCENAGLKCFSYFFLPHKFVFIKNKLFNSNFRDVDEKEINYEMLPFSKLYEIYGDSRCVVDVENSGQHGLTMRSIEILGLRKKFITTNKDIVHYDFYNSNNILVIDRQDPVVDLSFFDKPYEELPEDLYNKYSLRNWVLEVLK